MRKSAEVKREVLCQDGRYQVVHRAETHTKSLSRGGHFIQADACFSGAEDPLSDRADYE
jgi:hypothetical protein